METLLPFAGTIIDLEEARRRMEPIDAAKSAAVLTDLKRQIDERRRSVELGLKQEGRAATPDNSGDPIRIKRTIANRAANAVNGLRNSLRNWYTFYSGYDPVFSWWSEEPYKTLDQTLAAYS